MFELDHPSLEYEHPYRRRTFWRVLLPRPFCWWVNKGEDCESVGAEHHWYNVDVSVAPAITVKSSVPGGCGKDELSAGLNRSGGRRNLTTAFTRRPIIMPLMHVESGRG